MAVAPKIPAASIIEAAPKVKKSSDLLAVKNTSDRAINLSTGLLAAGAEGKATRAEVSTLSSVLSRI